MKKLILLYWGCIILMYLSQTVYPEGDLRNKYRGRNFVLDHPDIFVIVIIVWMSAFSFLRTYYNDTVNYIHSFRNAETVAEYFADGRLWDIAENPLYNLYKAVVHDFTDNYHIYFMFPAILSVTAAVKLIKRYSVNPMFSLMVHFSIGSYVFCIAAMKQSVAIAIALIALPYGLDKKYLRFYLLIFLAMMFHTHAFIYGLVPLLMDKPWRKVSWIVVCVAGFIFLTYNITMGAVMNFALSLGVNVADFEVFDGHSINPLRVIVYSIPALLSLCFRKHLFTDSSKLENLFTNMSIVAVSILAIGLRQGANLIARMAGYYEIALCFSLPWMIEKLFVKRSARLVKIAAYVLFFGYFLYEFGVSKSFNISYRAISMWDFIVSLFR